MGCRLQQGCRQGCVTGWHKEKAAAEQPRAGVPSCEVPGKGRGAAVRGAELRRGRGAVDAELMHIVTHRFQIEQSVSQPSEAFWRRRHSSPAV